MPTSSLAAPAPTPPATTSPEATAAGRPRIVADRAVSDHRTGRSQVLLTSTSSDAHTWNLVFLQRFIQEHGLRVTNLGACVPDRLVLAECLRTRPRLVVVSTVNGHGRTDGLRLIGALRAEPRLSRTPVVIGGQLDTSGECSPQHVAALVDAGYDAVFVGEAAIPSFSSYLVALRSVQAA